MGIASASVCVGLGEVVVIKMLKDTVCYCVSSPKVVLSHPKPKVVLSHPRPAWI